MASLTKDMEDVAVWTIGGIVILALLWVLYQFRGFFSGFGSLFGGTPDSGTLQSIQNAAAGFPSGADPGTVPSLQIGQGISESLSNFNNYVFGSPSEQSYWSTDEIPVHASSSPTPDEIQQAEQAVTIYGQTAQPTIDAASSDPMTWLQQNGIF